MVARPRPFYPGQKACSHAGPGRYSFQPQLIWAAEESTSTIPLATVLGSHAHFFGWKQIFCCAAILVGCHQHTAARPMACDRRRRIRPGAGSALPAVGMLVPGPFARKESRDKAQGARLAKRATYAATALYFATSSVCLPVYAFFSSALEGPVFFGFCHSFYVLYPVFQFCGYDCWWCEIPPRLFPVSVCRSCCCRFYHFPSPIAFHKAAILLTCVSVLPLLHIISKAPARQSRGRCDLGAQHFSQLLVWLWVIKLQLPGLVRQGPHPYPRSLVECALPGAP